MLKLVLHEYQKSLNLLTNTAKYQKHKKKSWNKHYQAYQLKIKSF